MKSITKALMWLREENNYHRKYMKYWRVQKSSRACFVLGFPHFSKEPFVGASLVADPSKVGECAVATFRDDFAVRSIFRFYNMLPPGHHPETPDEVLKGDTLELRAFHNYDSLLFQPKIKVLFTPDTISWDHTNQENEVKVIQLDAREFQTFLRPQTKEIFQKIKEYQHHQRIATMVWIQRLREPRTPGEYYLDDDDQIAMQDIWDANQDAEEKILIEILMYTFKISKRDIAYFAKFGRLPEDDRCNKHARDNKQR